jgi:hypothetical protein
MAKKLVCVAYEELTSRPPDGDALAIITPPRRGYLRVHFTLTNLTTSEFSFALDVYPSTGELSDVKVKDG